MLAETPPHATRILALAHPTYLRAPLESAWQPYCEVCGTLSTPQLDARNAVAIADAHAHHHQRR